MLVRGIESAWDGHEKYRTVLAVLDEGVVLYRPDGSIADCNPGACRILGLSEDDLLGHHPRWQGVLEDGSLFPPDDDPARVTRSTGASCRDVVMGIDRPDGTRRWISVNSAPLPGEGAPPFAAVVSFSDITRSKETAELLRYHSAELRATRQSLRLVESVIENAREAMVILAPGGGEAPPVILYVNPAFTGLTGYTLAEAIGRSPFFLGGPKSDPHLFEALQRTPADKTFHGRAVQYKKDGMEVILDWTVAALRDGLGNLTHWLAVLHDVTDLVRLRESLRESERLSAMGALLATVSHEVRNPLFGIATALTAFEGELEGDPRFLRHFDLLRGEVQRLTDLVQDLLDYGRPPRFEAARESLEEVLHTAAALCGVRARRRGVEVRVEAEAGLPALVMDRRRLVQACRNLLDNAVEHAPAGSCVLVRARRAPEGEAVLATVEDRGPGLCEEDLPHLFEPFFSRRDRGTGLGLAIVRTIVEQHGGTVCAANRPGGGALFSIELPAEDPAASPGLQGELFGDWPPRPPAAGVAARVPGA